MRALSSILLASASSFGFSAASTVPEDASQSRRIHPSNSTSFELVSVSLKYADHPLTTGLSCSMVSDRFLPLEPFNISRTLTLNRARLTGATRSFGTLLFVRL